MPVIVYAGRKGGCGKTTGATNFAAYLASKGEKVALLDSDPERQAQTFSLLRGQQPSLPQFPFEFVSGDVRRTVISLAQEYTWVVVDTPGLDSTDTQRAIAIADVAVFPCKNSIYDLKTMPLADELIERCQAIRPNMKGLIYSSEGSPGKAGAARRSKTKAKLDGLKTLRWAEGHTVARSAYKDAAEAGAGVTEWGDKVAAAEFETLAQEIMNHVQA